MSMNKWVKHMGDVSKTFWYLPRRLIGVERWPGGSGRLLDSRRTRRTLGHGSHGRRTSGLHSKVVQFPSVSKNARWRDLKAFGMRLSGPEIEVKVGGGQEDRRTGGRPDGGRPFCWGVKRRLYRADLFHQPT